MTKEHGHILVGDIGGTKTVVTLLENTGDGLEEIRESVFSSQEHRALEEILDKFFREAKTPPIQAACFGIAGAVDRWKEQPDQPTVAPRRKRDSEDAGECLVPGSSTIWKRPPMACCI